MIATVGARGASDLRAPVRCSLNWTAAFCSPPKLTRDGDEVEPVQRPHFTAAPPGL